MGSAPETDRKSWVRRSGQSLLFPLAELRPVPDQASPSGERPRLKLQHHERLIRPVLVGQPEPAGAAEAEPGVVFRMPENDHESVTVTPAHRQPLADEG